MDVGRNKITVPRIMEAQSSRKPFCCHLRDEAEMKDEESTGKTGPAVPEAIHPLDLPGNQANKFPLVFKFP